MKKKTHITYIIIYIVGMVSHIGYKTKFMILYKYKFFLII